jgi:D-alanine-D-alanine ligase-like ATP-grasp enzyme
MKIGIYTGKGKPDKAAVGTQEAVRKELVALGHDCLLLSEEDIKEKLWTVPPELLFNLRDKYHGRNDAAQMAAICEAMGIAYTGSDGVAQALACDKHLAKVMVAAGKASVAEGNIIRALGDLENVLLPLPLFAKPLYGSNGLAISSDSLIREETELYPKVGKMLGEVGQPVLVEEFMPGREFCVGLWGEVEPEILGIAESSWTARKKQPFIFNFEKYAQDATQIKFTCPAEIDTDLATDISNIARIAWQALGCHGYATVDIRLDEEGMPYFLELDTVPCLHPELGKLPFIAATVGVTYQHLIEGIVNLALKRAEGKE